MQDKSKLKPDVFQMWMAYAFAPAVAPVSFVVLFFALGVICSVFGIHLNAASAAIFPRLAMTTGLGASYLVAGFIGMPIAFALRHYKALNFYTVHLFAFVWCCVFAAISRYFVSGDGIQGGQAWGWFFYVLCMTAPPTLLSATSFWLITRASNSCEAA